VAVRLAHEARDHPLAQVQCARNLRRLCALCLQGLDLDEQAVLPRDHRHQTQRRLAVEVERVLHQPACRGRIPQAQRVHQLEDAGRAGGGDEPAHVLARDCAAAGIVGQFDELLVELAELVAHELGQVVDCGAVELDLAHPRPLANPVGQVVLARLLAEHDARLAAAGELLQAAQPGPAARVLFDQHELRALRHVVEIGQECLRLALQRLRRGCVFRFRPLLVFCIRRRGRFGLRLAARRSRQPRQQPFHDDQPALGQERERVARVLQFGRRQRPAFQPRRVQVGQLRIGRDARADLCARLRAQQLRRPVNQGNHRCIRRSPAAALTRA